MDALSGADNGPAAGGSMRPSADAVSREMEEIFGITVASLDARRATNLQLIRADVGVAPVLWSRWPRARLSLAITGGALVTAIAIAVAIFPGKAPVAPAAPSFQAVVSPTLQLAQAQDILQPPPVLEHASSNSAVPRVDDRSVERTEKPRQPHKIARRMHRSNPRRVSEPSQEPTQLAARQPESQKCDSLGDVALAWCMRPKILDADSKLRGAYDAAVRAGVDRHVLVSYRREWKRLRRKANSDPYRVKAGYDEVAQKLTAAVGGDPE